VEIMIGSVTRRATDTMRIQRRDRRIEAGHMTGSPEGREPVYVSNISYAVCAHGAGLQ
jgi:hypothetical protein